jgi:pimeloyl-ACP methyl ester carboxylesterase
VSSTINDTVASWAHNEVVISPFSLALLLVTWIVVAWSGATLAEEATSKYVRRSDNDTVIVFVHGVLGDGVSTWTNENGAYWPDLLKKDHTFDGADIYVVSYPTGLWATLSIDELAENMRTTLIADGITAYKKIIFLSHSMGGLVTRAYLLKYPDVAARTAFAYFFSSPTTGAELASLALYILKNAQISQMKSMDAADYLANLYRQWVDAGFAFPSYCAYEKRNQIVSMASAAALCTGWVDPIDTDHVNIVKPANESSMAYKSFKAAYMKVFKKAGHSADDDLRLNFYFDFGQQDALKISYIFRNLQAQSVFVRDFRLVELVGHNDDIENQDSVGLCTSEAAKQKLMILSVVHALPLPGGQALRLPFDRVGNDALTAAIYEPIQSTVDDMPAKDPISIDGGKNKIVVVTFRPNRQHLKQTSNFFVFCPVLNTIDTSGRLASAMCQGFSQALINGGTATKEQGPPGQFRILPQTTALACPLAD